MWDGSRGRSATVCGTSVSQGVQTASGPCRRGGEQSPANTLIFSQENWFWISDSRTIQ